MKKTNNRQRSFNHHEIFKIKHQLAKHEQHKIRAIGHFLSMLTKTYATATTWQPGHILSLHNSCHLPCTQSLKLQAFKGKDGPTPNLKLDIPANLQVGAYRAAVYTTKIILALARVSKQQSQPFMVRVEINIAESRVWGASQPR